MMMRRAVLVTPSRSTRDCSGSVRWLLPAAVMIAFLISTGIGIAFRLETKRTMPFRRGSYKQFCSKHGKSPHRGGSEDPVRFMHAPQRRNYEKNVCLYCDNCGAGPCARDLHRLRHHAR